MVKFDSIVDYSKILVDEWIQLFACQVQSNPSAHQQYSQQIEKLLSVFWLILCNPIMKVVGYSRRTL